MPPGMGMGMGMGMNMNDSMDLNKDVEFISEQQTIEVYPSTFPIYLSSWGPTCVCFSPRLRH